MNNLKELTSNSLQNNSNLIPLWGALIVLMPVIIKRVDVRLEYITKRMSDYIRSADNIMALNQGKLENQGRHLS